MSNGRTRRAPIFYLGIAAGLALAALLWAMVPQNAPDAAGRTPARNFDKNVQLLASSSVTITFQPKTTGQCKAVKCGKFQGTVTSSDSRCLQGRTVQIKNASGTVVATATTVAAGAYSTEQLTGLSGSYTATVTASSGYGYTCDAASSGSVTV